MPNATGPNSTAPPSRVMQGSREQSMNTTKTPGPASAPSCLFKMSPQGTKLSRTLRAGLLLQPSGPYLGAGTYRGTGNRILLPSDWLDPGALCILECKRTHQELTTYVTDRKRHRDVWNSESLQDLFSQTGAVYSLAVALPVPQDRGGISASSPWAVQGSTGYKL